MITRNNSRYDSLGVKLQKLFFSLFDDFVGSGGARELIRLSIESSCNDLWIWINEIYINCTVILEIHEIGSKLQTPVTFEWWFSNFFGKKQKCCKLAKNATKKFSVKSETSRWRHFGRFFQLFEKSPLSEMRSSATKNHVFRKFRPSAIIHKFHSAVRWRSLSTSCAWSFAIMTTTAPNSKKKFQKRVLKR